MKRMFINRLRNARIKNIVLGLLCMLPILILYLPPLTIPVDPKRINLIGIFGIPYLIMGLLLFVPFQQTIESVDESEFRTYLQIGWLKTSVKKYSKQTVTQILLEQDRNKFFCLTIKISDEEDWIVEKHPTLDKAEERLTELRTTIG